jgi:hypothetical protein
MLLFDAAGRIIAIEISSASKILAPEAIDKIPGYGGRVRPEVGLQRSAVVLVEPGLEVSHVLRPFRPPRGSTQSGALRNRCAI